eukprot:TRINITY_DN2343_c0_g1_i1.p1 TRINITY_DN2343_c0_g1~~TRINITY_DN2343_c0_g1_i1.p1  ORF type:complete len:197 (+),score=32.97 TRINITY_DN2343_c0_g1_i1:304-894(+)
MAQFALELLHEIDWSQPHLIFAHVPGELCLPLMETAKRISPRHNSVYQNAFEMWTLPETAVLLRASESADVELRQLSVTEAQTVNDYWEYRHQGSLQVIEDDVRSRPSAGVFVQGELVSWGICRIDMSIGCVFTMHDARGKGYGKLGLAYLCSVLRATSKTPYCYIGLNNTASQKLFAAVGFVKGSRYDWIHAEIK